MTEVQKLTGPGIRNSIGHRFRLGGFAIVSLLRFFALSLLFVSTAPAAERFGLDHIGRIVRLSDPQIAPDGRSVIVIVSRANFDENRYDAELVLVDVATGTQKVLTRRRVSRPRWSPSGSSLAFLSRWKRSPRFSSFPSTAAKRCRSRKRRWV